MAIKKSAGLFNALGNEIRFKIVCCLAGGEKCVCCLFKKLALPQNLVSHHLAILKENGLISDRKEGKWVYYFLNKKALARAKTALADIIQAKKGEFND